MRKAGYLKFILLLVISQLLFMPMNVSANSWIDKEAEEYKELYGENAEIGDEEPNLLHQWGNSISPQDNILEELLAGLLAALGYGINALFDLGMIDLSIDGIVYGRMNADTTMRIDIAHFGLEKNNPYGIFAATLYYNLRRVAFTVIPIIVLFLLVMELFHNTQKGRAQLKQVIKDTLFFFAALYLAPYIVEAFLFFRDACMYVTGEGFSQLLNGLFEGKGATKTHEIFDIVWNGYKQSHAMVDALLVLATAFTGIFYLMDYIKIAALIAVTFGLLPFILILQYFKPKIVAEWANILFPNLLVPFIDMVLLTLPTIISVVYTHVFGPVQIILGQRSSDFVLGVVMLICVWSVRVIRDRMIKLLGFDGLPRASSLGMVLMMMMRMGMGSAGAKTKGTEYVPQETTEGLMQSAQEQKDMGTLLDKADTRISSMDMPDKSETFGMSDVKYDSKTQEFLDGLEDQIPKVDVDTGEEKISEILPQGEISDSLLESVMPPIQEVIEPEVLQNVKPVTDTQKDDVVSGNEGGMEEDTSETDKASQSVAEDSNLHTDNLQSAKPDAAVVPEQMSGADGLQQEDALSKELPPLPKRMDEKHTVRLPKPQVDETFRNNPLLSERDGRRYDNLAQLDALEKKMKENTAYMEKIGYSPSSFAHSYRTELAKNKQLAFHEERLRGVRDGILDKSSEQYKKANADYRQVKIAKSESDKRLVLLDKGYVAEKENAFYKKHVDYCRAVEEQYAKANAISGMDSKTYVNAETFKHAKQVEAVKKQHANFKNFDTRVFDGILTPQEKEAFYRERAVYKQRMEIIKVANTVAAVSGGVVGSAAGLYGGPMTSAMAGYAMGHLGHGLSDKMLRPLAEPVSETLVPQRVTEEKTTPQKERGVVSENANSDSRRIQEARRRADRFEEQHLKNPTEPQVMTEAKKRADRAGKRFEGK